MSFAFTTKNKSMGLPLRKNIKEHEAKKDEFLTKIHDVSDIIFELEFEGDFVALNDSCRYKDRLGEIFLGSYLENIAKFFERTAKDDFVLSEFIKHLTAKTIVIQCVTDVKPSGTNYQRYSVNSGKLVVTFTQGDIWVNIADLANFPCEQIPIIGGVENDETEDLGFSKDNLSFSLPLRKNIKDNEVNEVTHLTKMEQVTGITFTLEFEGNFQALNESCRYKNRLGAILLDSYLSSLVAFLTTNQSKDEFVFGEFLSNLTAKTIVIRCTTESRPSRAKYQRLSVEHGKLVVTFTDSDVWVNLGDLKNFQCEHVEVIRSDAEAEADERENKSEGDTTFSKDNKSLSLPLRKNIKDNEEKKNLHLKEIAAALGGEEMNLRIEHEPILAAPDFPQQETDRLGQYLLDMILGQLPRLFKNKLADEMSQEAFFDEVSEKTIVLCLSTTKKQSGEKYHRIRFVDGEMRVEFDADKVVTNLNDLANYDIESLL